MSSPGGKRAKTPGRLTESGFTFLSVQHGYLSRVPVWMWKTLMASVGPGELRRFNADPIDPIDYHLDIDYIGDGLRAHRLDVLAPPTTGDKLPVYIYFHGGGWTSGDKSTLTKYCASQAREGMVVVNVNYRMATAFRMHHILQDANASIDWVAKNIAGYGGDPTRVVLGGDSAGGQIAALLAAALHRPELAKHYDLTASLAPWTLRGLVQHCSVVDFSVLFERGFILSLNFVKMLVPASLVKPDTTDKPRVRNRSRERARERARALVSAARFLSPIEWLDATFPPVFVSTSERDYFYRANLNFIRALRKQNIRVDTLIFGKRNPNARHTWQQDARHPESQEVYRRLQEFVHRVTVPALAATAAN